MLSWCSHWTHWSILRTLNHCIQQIAYYLSTSSIGFLSIIVAIHKRWGLPISDQHPSTLSGWEMMWLYLNPALSAGNMCHVDYFTSFWLLWLDFLTCPHPALSPPCPWHTSSNCKSLNHVHQVCAESCTVGCWVYVAWRSLFSPICIDHGPLLLWLVWYHSFNHS